MNKHLTVAIVAGLLIAGCGDDEDEGLSKAEFLKQGNAICKKGDDAIDAAGTKAFGGEEPSKQELTEFAEQTIVPNVQREIDQLGELSPPEDDEAEVDSILTQAQSALDEIKAEPQLVATGDPFADVNKKAKAYGLTACAD